MDEGHPHDAITPYAASKSAADHIIESYVQTFGIDATVIRPFNNIGPRQNPGSYAGIVPIIVRRVLNGEPIEIFGDGEQTVDTPPESFSASEKYTDSGAVFGYGTAEGGPMRITTGGVSDQGGGYIQYQGTDALSVLDEANLEAIADELDVEYARRTADAAPVLPEAPSTTTDYTDSGEVGNVAELYWIAALVILGILGVELTRATVLIARLRRLRAPRQRSGRGGTS